MSETFTPYIFLIFCAESIVCLFRIDHTFRPTAARLCTRRVSSGIWTYTLNRNQFGGPATDRTPRMTDLLLTFMFRRAHIVQWLPILRVAMLIYDERFGPRRQNMQQVQEFDDDVLQVGGQGVERLSLPQSFTIVCFDGFPGRGELPVVHECPTPVIGSPRVYA